MSPLVPVPVPFSTSRYIRDVLIHWWCWGAVVSWLGVSFEPGQCQAPYHTWTLTWPIWAFLPLDARVWLMTQALRLC